MLGKYVRQHNPKRPTKSAVQQSKIFKRNKKGAGKPLSYVIEIGQEI